MSIPDGVIEDIVVLVERYCGRMHHAESSRTAGSTPIVSPDLAAAYRVLYFLPTAPPDLVKAAYRTLSKLNHPDSGGTTRQMQRVNEAYARLTHK